MNKMEIKKIMDNFSSKTGAQLKYYVIKSLFPEISVNEIKEIGNFNPSTFSTIKKTVEEKELPLLSFNVNQSVSENQEELQSELLSLREELQTLQHAYDELQAGALAELDTHIAQRAEDRKKIAALEDLARGLKIKLDYVQGKARGFAVKDSADWTEVEI